MKCPACANGDMKVRRTKKVNGGFLTIRYLRCPACTHKARTKEKIVPDEKIVLYIEHSDKIVTKSENSA